MPQTYYSIYRNLYNHYGPRNWWPAKTPFEMMIGAILVQNTNWRNVEKAMEQLRPSLQPETIDRMPLEELAQLIRPSGFFNIKAKRIKAFIAWYKRYDFDIKKVRAMEKEELRADLLETHGIGRETADVMLVYAFHKPVFVVDAYARRIFHRLGFDMPASYDAYRKIVEEQLPDNLTVYNEYHALLVDHAKETCKLNPRCEACPLLDICEQRIREI